jgi:hypothetical protein
VNNANQIDASAQQMALNAVVWGLPLVMLGRYLEVANSGAVEFNHFYMNTDIATPHSRAIGPNIDTVNGRAWLDLDKGPLVIGVPDTDDRYYSIQLQDMYMNSFAYIGRRTTGTKAGFFVITPPGFSGELPEGMTEIRSTTTKILSCVRTLVRGRGDLGAVEAINGAFTLGSLARFPQGQRHATVKDGALDAFQPGSRRTGNLLPHLEIAQSGAGYFTTLDALVRKFPPLPWDAPNLVRFASLGVGGTGSGASPACSDADLADAVQQGVALATRSVPSWSENGWLRRTNVPTFIKDPLQRAANNIYGPSTQIAEESVFYNLRIGPDDKLLNGANRYRLRFPPGQLPPVDAFWSLTLYNKSYFLFDNHIDRYGINDRTEGLRFEVDGSLELFVQADVPILGTANWLPSPNDEFQLVFRTYEPRAAVLDGSYRLPPLEIVG